MHRSLAVADALALIVAFCLSYALVAPSPAADHVGFAVESLLFVVFLPFWIVLFKVTGLYDQGDERTDHSTVDDVAGVFVTLTIGVWGIVVLAMVVDAFAPSTARIAVYWAAAIVLVPGFRVAARVAARQSSAYAQNTIMVGTGPVGCLFARKILAHPEYGLNLVGFVDSSPSTSLDRPGSLPIVGPPEALLTLLDEFAVERVIVAFTDDSMERTIALVRSLRNSDVQVDIVPRLFEVIGSNSTVHMLEGTPLVSLPRQNLAPSARFLKRSLDLALAFAGLVVLAPALLVVAVVIKADSRGPAFFRQVRRGQDESTFQILKFRTMRLDAENRKAEIAHLNLHRDADPRMFKVPDDPRITRVGGFLRRWSIDELPQLINVLRGEMSIVGPRPLILEEDSHVLDWARERLSLKPGITGLWQVLGRSDITFAEMTQLDYLYVTGWSLKQDVRLILLTIPSLFRPRKAF